MWLYYDIPYSLDELYSLNKLLKISFEEENIAPEAKLKDDLGIDSLDFVDIVVIVEKNFGFKIKPEEMQGIVTLSQFCDYIESKVG